MNAPDLHPDEWQLWRIPNAERRAALAHEIDRERHRQDIQTLRPPPPWLSLPPEKRTDESGPGLWPDLEPDPETGRIPRGEGDPPNVRHRYRAHVLAFDGWQAEPSDLLAAQFMIDPDAPRGDLLKAFGRWLEENGIGTGKARKGVRESVLTDRLRWIALYRLHRGAVQGAEYWRPLAGTEFQFWGRKDTAADVRDKVDRLGWFAAVNNMVDARRARILASKKEK
ncbi:MAG: hypothetical protein JJU00_03930 [Opitutales bacterium]|nr:hypothetical protein [Opitutales bacterium]